MKRYFVSGTDTGVGKTAVTAALAASFCARGIRTTCIKPLQSGAVVEDGVMRSLDADFIFSAAGETLLPRSLSERSPFCLKLPASPHLAAEQEGKKISIADALRSIKSTEAKEAPEISLIEGAGGLAVPINDEEMMLDLVAELGAEVVLVVRPALGTLNHSWLSLEALRNRGISVAAIVVSGWPKEPSLIELDNLKLLKRFAGDAALLTLPYIEGLDTESQPGGFPWGQAFDSQEGFLRLLT